MTGRYGSNQELKFWRVEGSLADLTAVRPVAFFTWNAHTFTERWARRGGLVPGSAAVRPVLYASHRVFATRVLHALLRGVTRDRLDLLGEEYFEYVLKPRLEATTAWKRCADAWKSTDKSCWSAKGSST